MIHLPLQRHFQEEEDEAGGLLEDMMVNSVVCCCRLLYSVILTLWLSCRCGYEVEEECVSGC